MESIVFMFLGYIYSTLRVSSIKGGEGPTGHTVSRKEFPDPNCETDCNKAFDEIMLIEGQNWEQGVEEKDVGPLLDEMKQLCAGVKLESRYKNFTVKSESSCDENYTKIHKKKKKYQKLRMQRHEKINGNK